MKYLIALLMFIISLQANEKVTLQLKWLHQFQFAGYYAAKEKGFYKDVGLDVEIKQRDLSKNNIEQVISGEAQYGITDSIIILYKAKKRPVTIVAPIFQHSPSIIITLKSSGIDSPYKLENKKMIFYKTDADGFGIFSMLKNMDLNIQLDRTKYKTNYKALMDYKADAYCGYLTNEPYLFKKDGVKINIINPSHYGLDLYGDILFTNTQEAKNHPNRVQKFKQATIKGWKYALNHKEELIQIIKNKYAKDKSIEHLRYEADTIEEMINAKSVPIGTLDKGRIRYTLDAYRKYGLIKNDIDIDNYVFKMYNKQIDFTKKELEWISRHPTVKLRVDKYQKPIIFLNKDNKVDGIVADYFKILSKKIGINILATAVNSNEPTYGSAEVFENLENSKNYLITKPYMHTNFVLFSSRDNKNKYKTLADLQYKKVAVLKDDKLMKSRFSNIKGIELIYADNILNQMSMLQYGEVDAIVGYRSYHAIISEQLFTNITASFSDPKKISISIGIDPKYEILYNILNKTLATLTPSAKLDVIEKWIKNTNRPKKDFLTVAENSYLKEKKVITMCTNPDWMPFEKIEDGKYIGMVSDYIKEVSKVLNIPIKLVETKEWAETLTYLQQRKCDITPLAMATKQRKKYLNFTKPYLNLPLVIVTRIDEFFINSISSIVDKKIGITKGVAYLEILKEKFPNINLIAVKNTEDGLKKVKNKELFGLIDTLATTGYHIQKNYIGELKIGGKFDDQWRLGIGTRNDEPLLNSIMNKAINRISPQKKQEFLNKWVSVTYDQGTNYKQIFQWTGLTIVIFSSILFVIMQINSRLKKEINIRKETEKKLQKISITDELTTLYNRRHFNEIFPKLINSAKRENTNICFAIGDIDFFKLYNDTYGHVAGDVALREVSNAIKNSLNRADDYCFRLGGEEFGILFKGLNANHAKKLLENVRRNIENLKIKHEKNSASRYVTASFGLIVKDANTIKDSDELYKETDALLYKAKDSGRNMVCTKDNGIDAKQ